MVASTVVDLNDKDNLMAEMYLHDTVHGLIPVNRICLDIVDTPTFQRLRDLKQLGAASFVYPSANHTRFEHSIGVMHLANTWISHLRTNDHSMVGLSPRHISAVTVAGLVHDLGHGPFSHLFDNVLVPRLLAARQNDAQHAVRPLAAHERDFYARFSHELFSARLFDHLYETGEASLDMDKQDRDFIKTLIDDAHEPGPANEFRFIYDIVANHNSQVDVDKFDYLQRDAYALNMKADVNVNRIMTFSLVSQSEIAFPRKCFFDLQQLFHTRYMLHRRVYSHRVATATGMMIVDALCEADAHFAFLKHLHGDNAFYLGLTDGILGQILRSRDVPALDSARRILQRVYRRDLYKTAYDAAIPHADYERVYRDRLSADAIADSQLMRDPMTKVVLAAFSASDIAVEWRSLNYAKQDKNPLDYIHFHSKYDPGDVRNVDAMAVSNLLPGAYQEMLVRVYCRNPAHERAVFLATHRFFESCSAHAPRPVRSLDEILPETMSQPYCHQPTISHAHSHAHHAGARSTPTGVRTHSKLQRFQSLPSFPAASSTKRIRTGLSDAEDAERLFDEPPLPRG